MSSNCLSDQKESQLLVGSDDSNTLLQYQSCSKFSVQEITRVTKCAKTFKTIKKNHEILLFYNRRAAFGDKFLSILIVHQLHEVYFFRIVRPSVWLFNRGQVYSF